MVPVPLRLYRGLTRPYDPARVDRDPLSGTDFTDCPYSALRYASGRSGVVLVLDVPERGARVTEELWPGTRATRFMVWGAFDGLLVATVPAKELRAEVRRAGVVGRSDEYKAEVVTRHIDATVARSEAAGA